MGGPQKGSSSSQDIRVNLAAESTGLCLDVVLSLILGYLSEALRYLFVSAYLVAVGTSLLRR